MAGILEKEAGAMVHTKGAGVGVSVMAGAASHQNNCCWPLNGG